MVETGVHLAANYTYQKAVGWSRSVLNDKIGL